MLDMYPPGDLRRACRRGRSSPGPVPLLRPRRLPPPPGPGLPVPLGRGRPGVPLPLRPQARRRPAAQGAAGPLEGLRYTSSTHTLFPIPLAEATGALLHFSARSPTSRSAIEAERRQYWQGAKRRLVSAAACGPPTRSTSPASHRALPLDRPAGRAGPAGDNACFDALAAGNDLLPGWWLRYDRPDAADRGGDPRRRRSGQPAAERRRRHAATLEPAQILVVGRESADGLADRLRLRWPGVELCTVPDGADPAQCAAAAITALLVALLEPGRHWRPEHLERLAAAGEGLTAASELPSAWPPAATLAPPPDREAMKSALASLPAGDDAAVLDLRAAAEPAGLLDLLGLSASLGAAGRTARAPAGRAVLGGAAGPARRSAAAGPSRRTARPGPCQRAAVHRGVGAAGRRPPGPADRPGPGPVAAEARSRLLEAVGTHPDLELWVGDAVSRRCAMSNWSARPASAGGPADAGAGTGAARARPARRARHARCRTDRRPISRGAWPRTRPGGRVSTRRPCSGSALITSSVLGLWRWLKGLLLQQAWPTALVGWAAVRAAEPCARTDDLDLALFTALCVERSCCRRRQGPGPRLDPGRTAPAQEAFG